MQSMSSFWTFCGVGAVAVCLVANGGIGAAHVMRNSVLSASTDRIPIPVGDFTKSVRKNISIHTELDVKHEMYDTITVNVTNNSSIPIWKIEVKCRASYSGDDSDSNHEQTYTMFMNDSIMPGQTKDESAQIWSGAGTGHATCSLVKVHTPVSWWDGFPQQMHAHL
jgi:hypothetical protein